MKEYPEKTRYSAEELAEFKKLILEKLEAARTEYKRIKENLQELIQSAEDLQRLGDGVGTEYAEKQQLEFLLARTNKYIDALERALIRIENGTYGICKVTGKLIPKERLLAVPVAETIVEVKTKPPR
ncbi:MAG: TraR/DksA family transcriptional regulator [Bacteroidia bacterium]